MVCNLLFHVPCCLELIERDESVWHPSVIDFVICRQKYVEKKSKFACGGIENPDVPNADAVFSILGREHQLWARLPKGGPSFLDPKISTVDIIF
jgi:hypothetical protein